MILTYACTYVSTYVVTCRDQTQCGGFTDSMSIDAAATATSRVSALSKDCSDNWVCLKMVSTPTPNGFADHYPY